MKTTTLLAFLAVAILATIPPVALAGTITENFSGTYGGGITITGVLTGTEFAPGLFDVESGSITLVGGPVVGSGSLDPDPNGSGNLYTYQDPPNSGGANYTIDNVFIPWQDPMFDDYGILFTVANTPVNLWAVGPGDYELFEGAWLFDGHGTFTTTPEAGSILLIGGGLLLLGGLLKRARAT